MDENPPLHIHSPLDSAHLLPPLKVISGSLLLCPDNPQHRPCASLGAGHTDTKADEKVSSSIQRMYTRPPHTTGSKCQVELILMGPFKNDGSSQIQGFKENSAPATFHGKTNNEKKKGKQTPCVQENTET